MSYDQHYTHTYAVKFLRRATYDLKYTRSSSTVRPAYLIRPVHSLKTKALQIGPSSDSNLEDGCMLSLFMCVSLYMRKFLKLKCI